MTRRRSFRAHLDTWLETRFGLVVQSLVIGVLTGLVIVAFRLLLSQAESFRRTIYTLIRQGQPLLLLPWIAGLTLIGLFLGWAAWKYPAIRGSGIPQIKGVLLGKLKMRWLPELPLNLVSSIIGLGAGLSLGRAGPSVQIGTYIGQSLERIVPRTDMEKKYLICSGASAGLAAAFNAPLAGVLFALEELNKGISPLLLACCMASSIAGDYVASHFFGLGSAFNFPAVEIIPLAYFPWILLMGVLCAVFGQIFKRLLYAGQDLYALLHLHPVFKPLLPLAVSVVLGIFCWQVVGGGHELVEHFAVSERRLWLIAVVLGVKLLFTALCYGSGATGGIFLPMLSCGALLGVLFGGLLLSLGLVGDTHLLNFLILGMAGFFAAVSRAPITGAVLILEMSGNLNHLSGLVLVCLSATIASDLLRSRPVYDVLLLRQLRAKTPRGVDGSLL